MKHILVVCAVIQNDQGAFLSAQRQAGKMLSGLWEFPGGKIDDGETASEALGREIREELGVEVEVGEQLRIVEHQYPEFRIWLIPFRCRIVSGDLVATEHSAIRWLSREDLWSVDWAPADIPIVREIETW